MSKNTCSKEGCDKIACAKGLCSTHYKQARKAVAPPCSVDGCANPAVARGLCITDYLKQRADGSLSLLEKVERTCSVEGCDEPHCALGLCRYHWKQQDHQRDPDKYRAQQRDWRAANAEYARERSRDYRGRNGDKIRAQERARTAADPQRKRDKEKRYRERYPEKVAAAKRRWADETAEARSAYFAEYQRQHVLRRRDSHARRRAWLRDTAVEPVSYEQLVAIHGMICHLCSEEILSCEDLHMDHVIPRERGGTHTYDNLRPAHADCNLRKGAKLMSELTWVKRAS